MILDEPMSGLDPNQAVEIRDLIKDIGRSRTVVLSTHNLAEVQVACDRVLIIAKGRIVADDTAEGLQERAGRMRYVVALTEGDKTAQDMQESVLRGLNNIERVRRIESEPGETRYEVLPKGDGDLRPTLFKAAVDNRFTLVGLWREGQNLEQIFRELTTTNGSEPARPASASAVSESAPRAN
jgi:ABC-2 type transport system ATP-binding protein